MLLENVYSAGIKASKGKSVVHVALCEIECQYFTSPLPVQCVRVCQNAREQQQGVLQKSLEYTIL